MHACVNCGRSCDCDCDDLWYDIAPDDCDCECEFEEQEFD